MSIADRGLKPGITLVARYKKTEYRAEVVAGEGDKVLYRLKDGREFKSPSAAGSAVMGGVACNGWRFWSLDGDLPSQKATRTPTAAKGTASKAKGKGKAKAQVTGPRDGTRVDSPVACGDCGQDFADSRAAAEHMAEAHGAPEAPGNGAR